MSNTATIAVTEYAQYSRSKGWAACKINGQSDKVGTTIEATMPATHATGTILDVVETAEVRRATRTEKVYERTELVATGNPADIYDGPVVTITGVARRPGQTVTPDEIAEAVAEGIADVRGVELIFERSFEIRDHLKAAGAIFDGDDKSWTLEICDGYTQTVTADQIEALTSAAAGAYASVSLA